MLGDRNTFAVELSPSRVARAARERNTRSIYTRLMSRMNDRTVLCRHVERIDNILYAHWDAL
jgi:hypothetical protein